MALPMARVPMPPLPLVTARELHQAERMDQKAIELLLRVGGASLVREVAEAFLTTAPGRLEAIGRGLKTGDADGISRAAHGLRGSAGQVGGQEVRLLCEEMQRLG